MLAFGHEEIRGTKEQIHKIHDYEHHNRTSPSLALLTNHGFSGCHLTSSTPSPSVTLCPRRIFRGTIKGLSIKSSYTVAWKMWIVPSSEADANRGRVGWKVTDRRALVWYLLLSTAPLW